MWGFREDTGVDIFPFTPDPKSRNEMYLFQKVRKEIAEPTVAQADLGGSKTMIYIRDQTIEIECLI